MTPSAKDLSKEKKLQYFINSFCHWLLFEPWPIYMAIGIGLIFPFANLLFWPGEFCARLNGVLLQFFGIGTVILGIGETRKIFGQPGIISIITRWFSNMPKYGHLRMYKCENKSAWSVEDALTFSNITDDKKNIYDRINQLEQNFLKFREESIENFNKLHTASMALAKQLAIEEQKRELQNNNIDSKLERAQTGGLHISAMGAFWLFIGVILTSLPQEIAALFAR